MRRINHELSEGILFTDQYQLTMAQLYYRMGIHETPAQYEHFFRIYPDYGYHKAGYCINAGLGTLVDWKQRVRFTGIELDCLRSMTTSEGARLFGEDFLGWLSRNGDYSSL